MQTELQQYFSKIIFTHYALQKDELSFDIPPKKEFGDFSFGAFQLARDLKKSPQEIAQELFEFLQKDTADFIQELKLVGPYINIYLKKDIIFSQFLDYLQQKEKASKNEATVIIDYIGANVGKPLHIGHMCTPNIGQTLINLHKKLGFQVIGDSHIGDWGIIFGKLIVGYKKYGNETKLQENAVEHLFQLYVQISQDAENTPILEDDFRRAFKSLSEGNPDFVELWKKFTASSIEAMNKQLSRLNVHPDYNIGESFYEGLGLPKLEDYPDLKDDMRTIVQELVEKKIATQNDDGSVGVVFPDELKISSCILQKRDGTHGYLASDLATIKYRVQNWNPDKIIYSVDVRQQLHLKQVFTVADMAGWTKREGKEKTELFHAYNGFISLKDGAMSTRKGRIIKLEDLLDEAEKRARDIILEKRPDISPEEMKQLQEIVGIGAIKYGYLKKSRETDTIFDWDEFLTFEGNSGPYIQYAYVRALNILQKEEKRGVIQTGIELVYEEESNLIQKILQYKQALKDSASSYAPHILAKYIYELTKEFNGFYSVVPVTSEEDTGKRDFRFALVEEFSLTLKDALGVLAIDVPDKM